MVQFDGERSTAQFLGARNHWKTGESRFWAWADRRIRRGI